VSAVASTGGVSAASAAPSAAAAGAGQLSRNLENERSEGWKMLFRYVRRRQYYEYIAVTLFDH